MDAGTEIQRNPDGTWPKGQSGNPAGSSRMTWQQYADRIDHFLKTYSRGELKAIVTNVDEFDKLVVRDALIVQTIAESLAADGLMSRKELLNRVIGEAVKREELTGANGTKLFGNDARSEIEGKLISDVATRGQGTET